MVDIKADPAPPIGGPAHCSLCGKPDLPVELHELGCLRFLTWACDDCEVHGQVFNGIAAPESEVERIALQLVPPGGEDALLWTIGKLRDLDGVLREDPVGRD